MADIATTLPKTAEPCKRKCAPVPNWKEKLRAALAARNPDRIDQWTLASIQRAETGKISKGAASGKSFAQHMGHEVTRYVVEAETARNLEYLPTAGAHCVHVILRLKKADNLEDFLGSAMARHGMNMLHRRAYKRNPPEGTRPELLLATVEQDGQGVHVHAVVYNRTAAGLEVFAGWAWEVFAGFTLVKEAHTVPLKDDTQLVRVAGYGLKRTVPIAMGKYPAVFLGSIYTATEWRGLARAFSRVLS